jgi:hypothetical protein
MDRPPPDDKERARLRRQALTWLRAELGAWSGVLDKGTPQARTAVQTAVAVWQADADLAGLRDREGVAKLPPEEQKEWQKLWAEVSALRKKAQEGK